VLSELWGGDILSRWIGRVPAWRKIDMGKHDFCGPKSYQKL